MRLGGQLDTLQRQRGLAREGFEQVELLGPQEPLRLRRAHADHTDRAARGDQWEIQGFGACQRVCPLARELAVVVDPLRHALVVRVRRKQAALVDLLSPPARDIAPGLEASHGVRQQDHHLAIKRLADILHRDTQHFFDAACAGELAAHGIERGDTLFAGSSDGRLLSQPHRQRADHQTHCQHHREGDEILRIRHRKGQVGTHKKEVERRNAQHGCNNRWPTPTARCNDHDPQQIDHHQVGEREMRKHQPGEHGTQHNDQHALAIL